MRLSPLVRLIVVGALAVACGPFLAAAARAEIRIDITKGQVQPMPIAITDFFGASPADAKIGADVAQVVSADLERSGLFKPIDSAPFIQTADSLRSAPRFADWRRSTPGAGYRRLPSARPTAASKVEFRLWDIYAETSSTDCPTSRRRRTGAASPHRRRRHLQAADRRGGLFRFRIVYVSETGPQDKRIKRLAIMDQTAANHRFLTDGRNLVLTPRFSPSSQEITYLSYFNNKPRVYVFNIDTGQQEVLGDFPGMTFAPRFSPDGNQVVLTLAVNGNSEIYRMDLRTRRETRLTDNPAIDTSPSYSPDGSHMSSTPIAAARSRSM